jgi:hypothetical protein
MTRANAEELIARLTQLQGMYESILLGPVGESASPRGSIAGSPLVNGGSQTGFTLATDGWTGTLLRGDWIAVDNYIYKITEDKTGPGTVEFSTRLRTSPADNAVITVISPRGKFRLQENEFGYTHDIEDNDLYRLDSVKAIEAI